MATWLEKLKEGDTVIISKIYKDPWLSKVIKTSFLWITVSDGTKFRVKDGYAAGTKPRDREVLELMEATLTAVAAVKDRKELLALREEFDQYVEARKYSLTSNQLREIIKIARGN